MQKTLIVLIVGITGLLSVGCATLTPEQMQQKRLRNSVVGTYEFKEDRDTLSCVFLDNGVFEVYENGEKEDRFRQWTIVNKEIHIAEGEEESGYASKKATDSSVAIPEAAPRYLPRYLLKIKNGGKHFKAEVDGAVIFNGPVDTAEQRKKLNADLLKELEQLEARLADRVVARINNDGSVTFVAKIRNGERTDFPKDTQDTWQKIK